MRGLIKTMTSIKLIYLVFTLLQFEVIQIKESDIITMSSLSGLGWQTF